MKALITAFFTAVNAVSKLFGGAQIDIDAQLNDIYKWLEEAGLKID